MNSEQLAEAEDRLYEQTQGREMTREEELLSEEYDCRGMMISIFAYWGINSITNEQSYCFEKYLQKYVERLGRRRFNKVREDQLKSFEGASIRHGVYTDGEGCTYNAIDWAN